MKPFIVAVFVIICSTLAYNFFYNNLENQAQVNYSNALNNCNKNLGIEKCDVELIRNIIGKNSNILGERIIWTSTNELISLESFKTINLSFNNLDNKQLELWNSYLIKNKQEIDNSFSEKRKMDIVAILTVILLMVIFLFLLPKLWRFILNRISDVSDATKGKKF